MASRDLPSTLDVATPERVALDLPIAGLGYRSLAYLVDFLVLFGAWVAIFFAVSLLGTDLLGQFEALSGLAQTLLVVAAFGSQWLFWTCFEGLGGGRTLGKRALRIRVVRDDGSPIGIFEAAVRNLLRLIDFLPGLYGCGLLAILFSREHRRVGDWLAGTVVVREVEADLDRYATAPAGSSTARNLSTRDLELLLDFLQRGPSLDAPHRAALSARMLARFCPALSEAERTKISPTWELTERALREVAQGAR